MKSTLRTVADAEFRAAVLEAPRPVLVDFVTEWCRPCQALEPTLGELAEELSGRIEIVKVDIMASPEAADHFGVTCAPTLVLVREGVEAGRKLGSASKPALASWLNSIAAGPLAD